MTVGTRTNSNSVSAPCGDQQWSCRLFSIFYFTHVKILSIDDKTYRLKQTEVEIVKHESNRHCRSLELVMIPFSNCLLLLPRFIKPDNRCRKLTESANDY